MNIFSFVREQRQSYKTDKVTIVDGLDFNQHDTLKTIELYYNSKFESGNKDSLGREKPFYNINKFRVKLATRATDLDVKDIRIESEYSTGYARSFLLSKENQVWMKEVMMGKILNLLGHTRAKYGGVLVKKTEHNDKLELHIVPWKDTVTDQTDILKGVIIERHFYTPSELMAMDGVWNNVLEAVKTAEADKDDDNEHDQKKTPGKYIEVWEVHGDLPIAYLKKEGEKIKDSDWYTYKSQVHILAGVDGFTKENGKITEHGLTLFSGPEKESPYKFLAWDKVDGRALGVGVVEDSFEAQVWTNDALLKEKDAVEIGSKVLFKTSDKKVGRNILTEMENGDIITLTEGKDFTTVNTLTNALPEFQNLRNMWKEQADKATSAFEVNTGDNLPSGTPYRLGAILNQEANSEFNYRREEAGLFIEEIYNDWVMPYLAKKLKKGHTLAAEFSKDELDQIDDAFVSKLLMDEILKKREQGILVSREAVDAEYQRLRQEMMQTKNHRYIKVPDDYYKDLKYKVSVIVTNEAKNKSVMLESASNILQTIAKLGPAIQQDKRIKKLLDKIMEWVGISPIEINDAELPSQAQPQLEPGQGNMQIDFTSQMNGQQTA